VVASHAPNSPRHGPNHHVANAHVPRVPAHPTAATVASPQAVVYLADLVVDRFASRIHLFRKLIADAVNGEHVARVGGVGFDLATQIFDVRIDAAVETTFSHAVQAVD